MPVYQVGQRDDRRRRVLNETSLGAEPSPPPRLRSRRDLAKGWLGKSKYYGDAVFMDEQPRLTDLVPVRRTVLLFWFLLGLAVIAGLEVLYSWLPEAVAMSPRGQVAALDLSSLNITY